MASSVEVLFLMIVWWARGLFCMGALSMCEEAPCKINPRDHSSLASNWLVLKQRLGSPFCDLFYTTEARENKDFSLLFQEKNQRMIMEKHACALPR